MMEIGACASRAEEKRYEAYHILSRSKLSSNRSLGYQKKKQSLQSLAVIRVLTRPFRVKSFRYDAIHTCPDIPGACRN